MGWEGRECDVGSEHSGGGCVGVTRVAVIGWIHAFLLLFISRKQ